jgi:hypothetical protein
MREPDLSVLIVTYNSRAFVGACIDAVKATVREHSYEIVVADNASTDGTVRELQRVHPDVPVVEMGHNAGFSVANNRAFAAATGRYAVLLNGDAVVQAGALDTLVSFLDGHPRAGVAAPVLENPDGSDQGTARAFPTPVAALFGRRSPLTRAFPGNRFSRRYLRGREHRGDAPFEVDWVSGACLGIRRDLFALLGGLDERFFMYWEDADLCRRVRHSSYGVWSVPTARVVHAEGSSSGGWTPQQVRRFHRSAYRYYAKHHLRGAKRLLRPFAAGALAARAAFVMARESVRRAGPGRAAPLPTAPAPIGAVEAGELR